MKSTLETHTDQGITYGTVEQFKLPSIPMLPTNPHCTHWYAEEPEEYFIFYISYFFQILHLDEILNLLNQLLYR